MLSMLVHRGDRRLSWESRVGEIVRVRVRVRVRIRVRVRARIRVRVRDEL